MNSLKLKKLKIFSAFRIHWNFRNTMDILKNITSKLEGKITEAGFEGANIVLYTDNEKFFKEGEGKIKEIKKI